MNHTNHQLPFLLAIITALLIVAACTRNPDSVAQLPTLAILPSATTSPVPTPSPSDIPSPTITLALAVTDSPSIAATPTCAIADWIADVDDVVREFFDTAETASKTSRYALRGIIQSLRQLQQDFERIDYPACVEDVYANIRSGMDKTVEGYSDFQAENATNSRRSLASAAQYFWNAANALGDQSMILEYRMLDAALFIWGGDSPNEATATYVAVEAEQRANILLTVEVPTLQPGPRCGFDDLALATAWANAMAELTDRLSDIGIDSYSDILIIRDGIAKMPYPVCIANSRQYLLNALDEIYLGWSLLTSDADSAHMHMDLAMAQMALATADLKNMFPESISHETSH